MATYKDIQNYIKEKYGRTVKTCWIAHMKELYGLNPAIAQNRLSENARTNPCPEKIRGLISMGLIPRRSAA